MTPQSEAELADLIAAARDPLSIRGGGTRALMLPQGPALSTRGLSGVTLYEPGALTLVVAAGTPLQEVRALLAAERQRLPFDPPDLAALSGRGGLSTIGGVAASNASGPARIQAGACRDCLIGLRFVDGRGRVVKNGGRVMKNVTGYDLVKLLAGSEGRLGVLSELSFRLQPLPQTEVTLTLEGIPAADQAAVMARALSSPWDVSGAASDPAAGRVWLRLEGFEEQTRYRSAKLRARLAPAEITLTEGAASAALWAGIRDLTPLAGAEVVIRHSARPSHMPGLLQLIARTAPAQVLSDLGGGWLSIGCSAAEAPALLCALQTEGARAGGHARLLKAPPAVATRLPGAPPTDPVVARLNAAIAAEFDPRGLFAPARLSAEA
ncbi:FAD-binding protein [Falsigemmobacter faecalis]|uniref:FAD-binding protein n=1 Tax=Falsigemmobacter faecalis TaxID=2488730 RepID=A0A3P3DRG7_9RHOB|nr:FAD-binding protein [Falsigemmobacter faecalis]RRH76847.1 FAD-binding protein [Falsigemmobacter faecalis]